MPDKEKLPEGWKRCTGCQKTMNPVDVLMSGTSGLCLKCVQKIHKKIAGR